MSYHAPVRVVGTRPPQLGDLHRSTLAALLAYPEGASSEAVRELTGLPPYATHNAFESLRFYGYAVNVARGSWRITDRGAELVRAGIA